MSEYYSLIKFIAQSSIALFSGFATFISLIKHPGMLKKDAKAAVNEWKSMYSRVAPLQASLTAISAVSSIIAFYMNNNRAYLYAGLMMATVVPYTLIFMKLTSNKIKRNDQDAETKKRLVKKWGKLHAVRTAIGLVALGLVLKEN